MDEKPESRNIKQILFDRELDALIEQLEHQKFLKQWNEQKRLIEEKANNEVKNVDEITSPRQYLQNHLSVQQKLREAY